MPLKKRQSYIKTLDRLKVSNLAGRLIRDIERILPPDADLFHEAVTIAGAPEATQSLRYLPFNRQVHAHGDVTTTLSLVVLFNNLRMERFFLGGFRERLSRLVYRVSSNAMDRYIRAVRLDRRLLRIMATAAGEFSIMGIVQRDEIERRRFFTRRRRFLFPLLLVPIADAVSRDYLIDFEKRQTIGKVKIPLLPLYRKSRSSALEPDQHGDGP
ncbi:hypothetical protein DSCA_49440 [Desulfosarcina alkanivorans]|uniref:Uncharacterized protein n=1 Tax=Desulfosarcina alkanivorans TaxID=571177 RepID=A0A5K7YXJ3_9BACT|nr:hypothetical protein [Desulfosarcina alkanivorans]BBO71014.1 hypothetical protein DSCA_49440 [Desulfosarcina alkanivorans]